MRQFIQKVQIKLLLVALLLGLSGMVSAGQPANMTDYPNLMRLLQQFYETVNHLQYLKQPNKTVFKSESYQCVQKLLFHPDVVNPALGEQSQASLLALDSLDTLIVIGGEGARERAHDEGVDVHVSRQ